MAKGIRSKIKRFWRTEWRKKHGTPVADARNAASKEILERSVALQTGMFFILMRPLCASCLVVARGGHCGVFDVRVAVCVLWLGRVVCAVRVFLS